MSRRGRRWQFSLRTLLILLTIAAIASACAGWLGPRRAIAVTVGLLYAGAITWVVVSRATRTLRRGLRWSPLERIYVSVSWAGIECGVLLGSAAVTWMVWHLRGDDVWVVQTYMAFIGGILIFAGTAAVVAYCGFIAMMMVLLLAGVLVLVTTPGFRARYEKWLSGICSVLVGGIASMLLPELFPDTPYAAEVTAAYIATPAILGAAISPLLLCLADRRYPADRFRSVSRETGEPAAW